MAIKKLQINYITPDQSKRLLELGVPADSTDLFYFAIGGSKENYDKGKFYETPDVLKRNNIFHELSKNTLPCWSALRLMNIIDICALGESSDPNIEEYPSTIKVMNKLHIPYVEYLVKSIERAVQLGIIDFSKLDIQ